MKTGRHPRLRRSLTVGAAGVLVIGLTSCTGRGGGQLPPDGTWFKGAASFGFSFSCEDKSSLTGPTGQLRIQLSYTDHGTNPLGSSFGIHGFVDEIDPVLESAICIGQNPAPGGKLIFLGRYRVTSSAAAGFPPTCTARDTTPRCRFEVIVQDNDRNRAPSTGDDFHITLSSAVSSGPVDLEDGQLDPATVIYTRGGKLSSGNLTVD